VHHARLRLALGHLHLEQELELPAGLVEQVGDPVPPLGDVHGPIRERAGRLAEVPRALVEVEERPSRHGAVDHVLAVVPGVVPATRHVERVVAAGGRRAGNLLVGEVAGGTSESRLARVRHGDLDAGAVVEEIRQGVVLQRAVDAGADREGAAALLPDRQHVAATGRLERGEVDDVHPVAGGHVEARGGRPAKGDLAAVAA